MLSRKWRATSQRSLVTTRPPHLPEHVWREHRSRDGVFEDDLVSVNSVYAFRHVLGGKQSDLSVRYDSWAAVFPISEGGPVTDSIAALSINLRIDDDVPFGDIALRLAARSLPTADR